MSIRITAIRLTGGTAHEHIVHLWWNNVADGDTGNNSRSTIVSWIEKNHGHAYVEDTRSHRVNVGVVTPQRGEKYLRTRADGVWTDNLFALPRR